MILERTEYLHTDYTIWEIGPYHPGLPGPLKLRVTLDGEVIVKLEVETGYLHRGLERAFETRNWIQGLPYADRLDPETAVFGEIAYCSAVEEICGIEIPARAVHVRMILSELSRIASHFRGFVSLADAVAADTFKHYVLRDRERILDLFELITGGRFALNFMRFGGVAEEVTEGFLERVSDVCEMIKLRIKEYNDLFSFNHALLARTGGTGVIRAERAAVWGLTGPNARAAGRADDVRKNNSYLKYADMDFEIPLGRGEFGVTGDAHDRYLVRLREVSQSIRIIKQASETMPDGPFCSMKRDLKFKVPPGEAYFRVESPRGLLGCHVVSDGGSKPVRVSFRPPSRAALDILPETVVGARLEDLPVILASLEIGVAEVDR